MALQLGQVPDGLQEALAGHLRHQPAFRISDLGPIGDRPVQGRTRPPGGAAQGVAQEGVGDAEEPGPERDAGPAVPGQGLEGAQEDLPGQVLGLGRGPRREGEVAVDRAEVAVVEVPEGGGVPHLGGADQGLVVLVAHVPVAEPGRRGGAPSHPRTTSAAGARRPGTESLPGAPRPEVAAASRGGGEAVVTPPRAAPRPARRVKRPAPPALRRRPAGVAGGVFNVT